MIKIDNPEKLFIQAEDLYKQGTKKEALEKYVFLWENADEKYLEDNLKCIKRIIQISSEITDAAVLEKNASLENILISRNACEYMKTYSSKFAPDENGDVYLEISDRDFLLKYEKKTYENKYMLEYFAGEVSSEEEFILCLEKSVNPEFIYTGGMYLESIAGDDIGLMKKYGKLIARCYELYLMSADPFDFDIEKITHAHNILDYYYGFGYGVEKNIEVSMLHENANRNIRRKTGKKKADSLAGLLNNITSFKG